MRPASQAGGEEDRGGEEEEGEIVQAGGEKDAGGKEEEEEHADVDPSLCIVQRTPHNGRLIYGTWAVELTDKRIVNARAPSPAEL